METQLSLKDRKVNIGPDHPFAIFGERINPTRSKNLPALILQGDFSIVQEDARR